MLHKLIENNTYLKFYTLHYNYKLQTDHSVSTYILYLFFHYCDKHTLISCTNKYCVTIKHLYHYLLNLIIILLENKKNIKIKLFMKSIYYKIVFMYLNTIASYARK